jgi:predicted transcriptional regulator
MNEEAGSANHELVELTTALVCAYVGTNSISVSTLPEIISCVYAALAALNAPPAAKAEKPIPRVPIKKTVTPDAIISLEDGKPYKSLKRHLKRHGLTPAEYRAKWGLPSDYPMVAASYAAKRSALAKSMGLGRKDAAATAEATAQVKPRGRRKTA